MKTIFEAVTEKFWETVEADADLVGFMRTRHGRVFKMDTMRDTPFDVKPTDCPALIAGPAELPIRQATNRQEDYQFTLAVDLRTAEPSVWTAVNFWALFAGVLAGQRQSLWGLPYLYDLTVESTAWRGLVQANRGIQWQVSCNTVFHLRRDARAETLFVDDE